MALYEVFRTDAPQAGEFVSAVVVAGGRAQARDAVRHLEGVTAKNVTAERYDTTSENHIVSVYMDERERAPQYATADQGAEYLI
ncbi:hypothetical protein ACQEU8_02370 [Streptomyces sp. CA-250714]|uniref:hypothetical protein n=1 Tax=Streptomyces sp. CA-250714 TaxID=3240060 RepID=UPI003D9164DC